MRRRKRARIPGTYRKFGSIRVLRDGRVEFSEWTVPSHPEVDFMAEHWGVNHDDRFVFESTNYDVSANVLGEPVFYLHLTRHRVTSAGFTYILSPTSLRKVVSLLRDIGNGIERWIIPALEYLQGSDVMKTKHADTYKIIPELLDSVRDLPVAEAWQRERRAIQQHWARWLREHPEDAAKVPAPWVLAGAKKARTRSRAKGKAPRRRQI